MNKDISLIYSLSNLYMFLTIFLSLSIVNIIYICYQSYSKNKNMNDFNTPGNIIALVSLALLMISDILSYKIFFFINIMNKIPRSLQTNRNELNIIYEFIGDINVLTKKFTISIFIYIIVIILLIVSIIMLSLELNKKIKNYKAKKL